jgi:hypothetical protein
MVMGTSVLLIFAKISIFIFVIKRWQSKAHDPAR